MQWVTALYNALRKKYGGEVKDIFYNIIGPICAYHQIFAVFVQILGIGNRAIVCPDGYLCLTMTPLCWAPSMMMMMALVQAPMTHSVYGTLKTYHSKTPFGFSLNFFIKFCVTNNLICQQWHLTMGHCSKTFNKFFNTHTQTHVPINYFV